MVLLALLVFALPSVLLAVMIVVAVLQDWSRDARCRRRLTRLERARPVTMRHVMQALVKLARAGVVLKQDPSLGERDHRVCPVPSGQRLKDACGWEPSIPLEDTLGWLLDYWRSR